MSKNFKREAFFEAKKVIASYRTPVIFGLRRIGKTTILKQLELEFKNAKYIDWSDEELRRLKPIVFYNKLENLAQKHDVLLFDEVQEVKDWDRIWFGLWNKFSDSKTCSFVITGSSLLLKHKKLGSDRSFRIYLDSLSFNEYCNFTKKEKTLENFEYFLGRGFPDYVDYNFEKNGFSQIINTILWPIIEEDILYAYRSLKLSVLRDLVSYLGTRAFGLIKETSISKKLEVSRPTIREYISILERAHVLKKVYRVNQDGKKGRNKRYKIYLNPHFYIWINGMTFAEIKKYQPRILGHIIESYWIHRKSKEKYNTEYYLLQNDSTGKEIDFVKLFGQNNVFKEIHELKYKNKIQESDYNYMHHISSDKKYAWAIKNDETINDFEQKSILEL